MFAPPLRVRSISDVILELPGKEAAGGRPIDTLFRILKCHPHGSVETVCILPLDCGLQRLTYAETVFRQLHRILVVDLLIIVGPSIRIHR
jgi:hypothetical protein